MQPDVPVPEQMAAVPGLIGEMLKEQLESLPPPAESLYHYTDAKGLMGILKTNELWATDALYTNDRFEIFHGLFVLNQLVKQRGKDAAAGPVTGMMTIGGKEFGAIVNTYVISFCPNGDLLSQWRGYAHPGGYSIGFDPNLLKGLTSSHVMLAPVIYDRAEQESKIGDLVLRWSKVFDGADPTNFNPQVIRLGAFAFAQTLSFLAALFKDDGFREEAEWRLVYRPQLLLQESVQLHVDYRELRGIVVGYARIPLPQITEKAVPVRDVTVGPTDNPDLARMGVFHFQKSLGYPEEMIRVSRSVIPLR